MENLEREGKKLHLIFKLTKVHLKEAANSSELNTPAPTDPKTAGLGETCASSGEILNKIHK